MTSTSLPKNPSPPRAHRGLRFVYRAAVLLLLTELALQTLAFLKWRNHDYETATGASSARTVLCIGDSLTHGTGATHPSMTYPAQLGRQLKDQTQEGWNIVNDGWPGRNSRQVAVRIRDQLETFDPRFVCVLVGANDFWSTPNRLELRELEADTAGGFPIRFRLGLIASIAVHMMFDDAGPAAAMASNSTHPFLGAWHNEALDLRFSPNGHLTLGATEGHWYLRRGSLELHLGVRSLPTEWKVVGDTLELDGAWPTKLSFERGDSGTDRPLQAGWRACHQGELNKAVAHFDAAMQSPQQEAEARLGKLHVAVQRRDKAAILDAIKWFEGRAEASPSPKTKSRLVEVYIEADDAQLAMATACELLAEDPLQYASWRALARYGEQVEFRQAALSAVNTALANETVADKVRVDLLRSKASLLRATDPRKAVVNHLRAVLLDGIGIHLVLELRRNLDSYTEDMFRSCVAEIANQPAQRELLMRLYEKAVAGTDSLTSATLAHHLKIIVEACQAKGAQVILLTYPYYAPRVEQIIDDLCRSSEVRKVDVRARFDQLLTTMTREDLFVLDGHCNDLGYTHIATSVATKILQR